MKFGLFYEHQLPRPWTDGAEERLLNQALEQIELADRAGFNSVWEVEHHFLEEYSHSSAPEVFLAAASQRTKNIRLGHGIVQLPPGFNHPARVAERIATLDLVSGGRVEFGTGESSSQMELGGFGVDRELKREQWEEALDAVTRMLAEEPFAGYQGRFISMPPRSVIPRPKQKPHPPLWVACSRRETILLAARKGIGALSFSFIEPEEAKQWVDDYYQILQSDECVAGGFAVNPNVAVVLPFMCHPDEATAIQRGIDGAHFFGYSLAHYYVFGEHRPGRTDLYEEFTANRAQQGFAREIVNPDEGPLGVKLLQAGLGALRGAVGTPDQVRELLHRYQAVGVDEVIFVAQAGNNQHEHICEAIDLFAREVLPDFAATAGEQEAAKRERLGEACERAVARRGPARQAPADYLVTPEGEPWTASKPAAAPASPAAPTGSDGHRRLPLRVRVSRTGEAAFARALRSRNDKQLERIVGSRVGQTLIFKGMERMIDQRKIGKLTANIQYELVDNGSVHRWLLTFADGRARVRPGSTEKPTARIRMPVLVFGRMVSQELLPARALMENKLEVHGNLETIARVGELLNRGSYW